MVTCPLKKRWSIWQYGTFSLIKPFRKCSLCVIVLMEKKRGDQRWWNTPVQKPSLGYLSMGVKCYNSLAETMKGTLSFVWSTMPLDNAPQTWFWNQRCLFMLSRALQLTHPPSHSSGVLVKRGGLLIWRLHTAAAFRGTMRSDPTPSTQGSLWARKPDPCVLVPERKWLSWFPSLHCISWAASSGILTPDRSQLAHTEESNSPSSCSRNFPSSCTPSGPSDGEPEAPLATKRLKLTLHGL